MPSPQRQDPNSAVGVTREAPLTLLKPIVSPSQADGETKNQDRASLVDLGAGSLIATVCDGTTDSPFADEAAQAVIDFVEGHQNSWLLTAHEPNAFHAQLDELSTRLLTLRKQAQQRKIELPTDMPDAGRAILQEAAKQKILHSHRTTVVSVRLHFVTDGLWLRFFRCGDSDLLVFDQNGNVCYTTANLIRTTGDSSSDRQASAQRFRFHHPTNITNVIPDSLLLKAAWVEERHYADDVCILVASDGFVDAFDGPNDLFRWLRSHYSDFNNEFALAESLAELHKQLDRRRGDDDISFVWIPSTQLLRTGAHKVAPT